MKIKKCHYMIPQISILVVDLKDVITTSGNELEPDVNK